LIKAAASVKRIKMKKINIPDNVDEYIKGFPFEVQKKLEEMRNIIKKAVPDAEENISYQMPAYNYNGNLVYFGAHSNHIGFYPTASGVAAFREELTGYKTAKGSIQFPFNRPLPADLITRIVIYRFNENLKKNGSHS
jgi:uncharacterized protein YdhG (YjbR/CyaY superfamily)